MCYDMVRSTCMTILIQQLYRGGGYHQHQRQFLQNSFPFLFPRTTVSPLPVTESAGILQVATQCALVLLKRHLPLRSQLLGGLYLQVHVKPAILFSEYPMVWLCHLPFFAPLVSGFPVSLSLCLSGLCPLERFFTSATTYLSFSPLRAGTL